MVNSIHIHIIDTGYFYADGGAMFGAIPKTAWQRRYPCNEENKCVLAMRTLLIITEDGRRIIVDNGAGNKHLQQLSYYQFFNLKDLEEELGKRNISCEEITDVILTHLHFDHCGYTTRKDPGNGEMKLAFPYANHWISKVQWENCHHPNPLEKESYFVENIDLIEQHKKLRLVTQDQILAPGVHLKLYDGHTPGQLVPYIYTEKGTFVFAGDVIPLAASVSPEWISAYDTFPVTSYNEKLRMLKEAAQEKQTLIYCHDAYTPHSFVKKVNNFYKITH